MIKGIQFSIDAVTPIVSMIFVVLISSTTIGSVIGVGIPYFTSLQEEIITNDVLNQFDNIIINIEQISKIENPDIKSINLRLDSGSIEFKSTDYDRTIILYSYDSNYDFNVRDLEVKSNQFELIIEPNKVDRADIYRIDDDGNSRLIHQQIDINNLVVVSDEIIEGRMYIDLFDSGYKFGKIWIFDSNPIKFSSSYENNIFIEKAAIVDTQKEKILKSSIINGPTNSNFISLHVYQTEFTKDQSISGSNVIQSICINSIFNKIQERIKITNLRIQFCGMNNKIWSDYIDLNSDGFEYDSNSNIDYQTIKYIPSFSNEIHLDIMQSVIRLEFI